MNVLLEVLLEMCRFIRTLDKALTMKKRKSINRKRLKVSMHTTVVSTLDGYPHDLLIADEKSRSTIV